MFDTRANYAIKTTSDGIQRFAFGWIPSKKGNIDFGSWKWGGTMIFHEVVQEKNTGILKIKPAEGIEDYFDKKEEDRQFKAFHCSVINENEIYQIEAPGGAACNVLAMLNKFGHKTALIDKVGKDLFGVKAALEEVGTDTANLIMDKEVNSTLAFVKTLKNGDRDFSFYRNPGADMMLTAEKVYYVSCQK